jgi:hypothetical protein
MNKFYDEIDKALKSYEEFKPYHTKSLAWITDRIYWCYKWKKITQGQMEELCDRAIEIMHLKIY